MIRIAAISDLHLTNSLPYTIPGDLRRKHLAKEYLDYFFDNIDDVSYLVVSGDICHTSVLGPHDLDLLMYFYKLILDSCIDTFIISGNHDIDGDKSILSFIGEHPPSYIHFKNNTVPWTYEDNDVVFHCIDYCNDVDFLTHAKTAAVDAVKDSKIHILIGHVGVKGTLHGSTKSLVGIGKEDIEEICKSFDFVFLGHHHKRQWVVDRKCLYVGSPWQTRIDEINCIPGGIVVNLSSLIYSVIENKKSPRFSIIDKEVFFPVDVKGRIVKPVFGNGFETEEEKLKWLDKILGHDPYYMIKPRLKEVFNSNEKGGGYSSTNKRKALLRTMKDFNEKKKRPKSFYKHALKLYEEINKGE